jgi:hypothetical protein
MSEGRRGIPFDPDKIEVRGTSVPVVHHVVTKPSSAASFSVAGNGTLVYEVGDSHQHASERGYGLLDSATGRLAIRGYPDEDKRAEFVEVALLIWRQVASRWSLAICPRWGPQGTELYRKHLITKRSSRLTAGSIQADSEAKATPWREGFRHRRWRVLGLRAGAKYLGISYWSLRDLVINGHVPAVRFPGPRTGSGRLMRRLLVDRRDLDALIDRSREREE